MTINEIMPTLKQLFPFCDCAIDHDGQIIIYTGKKLPPLVNINLNINDQILIDRPETIKEFEFIKRHNL